MEEEVHNGIHNLRRRVSETNEPILYNLSPEYSFY